MQTGPRPPIQDEQEVLLGTLMRKAMSQDAGAYGELLRKVRDILQRYFQRHLGRYGISDPSFSDDLLQEALLGIHTKRETWDPAQPFTPWMYAIARYKAIDLLRKRKNLSLEEDIETADLIAEALPESQAQAGADVRTLLGSLPARQREVLELAKVQDLPISEVAERMGMSVSAVKVTIHRSIKALRARMEGEAS